MAVADKEISFSSRGSVRTWTGGEPELRGWIGCRSLTGGNLKIYLGTAFSNLSSVFEKATDSGDSVTFGKASQWIGFFDWPYSTI